MQLYIYVKEKWIKNVEKNTKNEENPWVSVWPTQLVQSGREAQAISWSGSSFCDSCHYEERERDQHPPNIIK
jgi:hypothetical protein